MYSGLGQWKLLFWQPCFNNILRLVLSFFIHISRHTSRSSNYGCCKLVYITRETTIIKWVTFTVTDRVYAGSKIIFRPQFLRSFHQPIFWNGEYEVCFTDIQPTVLCFYGVDSLIAYFSGLEHSIEKHCEGLFPDILIEKKLPPWVFFLIKENSGG